MVVACKVFEHPSRSIELREVIYIDRSAFRISLLANNSLGESLPVDNDKVLPQHFTRSISTDFDFHVSFLPPRDLWDKVIYFRHYKGLMMKFEVYTENTVWLFPKNIWLLYTDNRTCFCAKQIFLLNLLVGTSKNFC